jgi:RNA polymerase sigma-70 factor (ECF subfamily)
MQATTLPHELTTGLPQLRQRLLRQARLVMHDAAQAEDLVQDTLLAVVEGHAGRRGDAALATWAIAILKHKIADWYRAPARRVMVQLGDDDEALADRVDGMFDADGHHAQPVPAWQQPEGQLARRQVMQSLARCMKALPAQTGRVFMMREWLGFEADEICQRLGLSADNTRQLLHRARMGLRGCMQSHRTVAGPRMAGAH